MPASHSGFAGFLDRSISMAAGYQIPLLGCPTGIQAQQPPHHLGSMAAGVPVAFPGLPGYNFIPYPHHRHMAHMNTAFELKVASPYHHHHHHHALLARGGPPFYPAYRPGSAEDPGRVAKVATRESTGALKAWLNEHLKNPYPTKGEKIMLAIITKMSLTQVSTWFANARRRLKKENRVSWASKGKSEDEEEEEDGDEGDEGEGESEEDERSRLEDRVERPAGGDMDEDPETQGSDHPQKLDMTHGDGGGKAEEDRDPEKTPSPLGGGKDSAAACQKPKIWSLAETATSEPARKHTSPDRGFRGPQQGSAVGRLWVDWAARNGLYLPPPYNPTKDTL